MPSQRTMLRKAAIPQGRDGLSLTPCNRPLAPISTAFVPGPCLPCDRQVSRRTSSLCMHSSQPNREAITRRTILGLLLSITVPPAAGAKIMLADPDAGSQVTTTDNGLRYYDVTTPPLDTPAISKDSVVTVHYILGSTGARNGWRIDSSHDREPLTFKVGAGQVISGLEEGVIGMRAGGVRRLLIPSRLGYRSAKDRPVPVGFAEYQRFKNIYLNEGRVYRPDIVMDITVMKIR